MKSKNRILNLTQTLTGGMIGGVRNTNCIPDVSSKLMSFDEIVELASKTPENNSPNEETSISHVANNKGWTSFSRLFMVSALRNEGVDDLRVS